jgi:hypothetical protein
VPEVQVAPRFAVLLLLIVVLVIIIVVVVVIVVRVVEAMALDGARAQGLTLLHFSAQRKRFPWDWGYM